MCLGQEQEHLHHSQVLHAVQATCSPGQDTQTLTTVDVNGDGRTDIVAGNKDERNKVYLNRGGNTFTVGIDLGTETDDTTSIKVCTSHCACAMLADEGTVARSSFLHVIAQSSG